MFVRIVFSVVVTLGLLLGAVAWHGAPGSDATPLEPVGVVDVPAAVEEAKQVGRKVAADVVGEAAEVKREVTEVARRAAAVAAARAAAEREVTEPVATPPAPESAQREAPEPPASVAPPAPV